MYFVILDFDDNGQTIALPCDTAEEAWRLLDTYVCKRWVAKEVKRPTKRAVATRQKGDHNAKVGL
jgi:hypothetical protein